MGRGEEKTKLVFWLESEPIMYLKKKINDTCNDLQLLG